jgi:hypothetical protein
VFDFAGFKAADRNNASITNRNVTEFPGVAVALQDRPTTEQDVDRIDGFGGDRTNQQQVDCQQSDADASPERSGSNH